VEGVFDFIEKRKFGILTTFMLHLAVLMYLQIETYDYKVYYTNNDVIAALESQEELIELNPDQIEVDQKQQAQWNGEVKNLTQDAHDTRNKSKDNFSKTSVDSKVEQNVKELEKQFFDEFRSGRTSSENGQQSGTVGQSSEGKSSGGKASKVDPKSGSDEGKQTGGDGGKTVYEGRTMVKYDLKGRFPHNNNDWYIRNPGYTCGSSSNGTVVVAIRVNPNGDVVSARYVPEMSNRANTCMIEKAEEYALKSRFAFKDGAPKLQDGFITYNFVSQ
jgi:hypothetical protein